MAPSIEQDLQRKLYDLLAIATPESNQTFRQFFTYGVVGANVLVFLGWQHAEQQQSQKKNRFGSSQRGQPSRWNVPQLNPYLEKLPSGEATEKFLSSNFVLTEHNVLRRRRWWTVLTSAFSHRQAYHLAANMVSFVTCADLALGPAVGMDPVSVAVLALGSAIAGSAAELLEWHRRREQRKASRGSSSTVLVEASLGASGMVNGMNVALTLLRPTMAVSVAMLPRPVPMWLATVAFAAWDYFNLDNSKSTGIGHAGHLGGAAFGALFYLVRLRGLGPARPVGNWPW